MYLRMYGSTKAPSLLAKYATDYIVLKEEVRQVFLDGFGNHLFDIKKVVFPPIRFYIGSYKFNGVKSASDFVKELGIFHFGEVNFHRNDSQGKVEAHKATHKVNYEYSYYVDKEEQVYRNIYSVASLSKSSKRKAPGVKGSNSHNPKPNDKEKEAARKAKEENARKIAEGAKKLLNEEKQREIKEEVAKTAEAEEKRKKEEDNLEKIAQIQKDIAQEALNTELGI